MNRARTSGVDIAGYEELSFIQSTTAHYLPKHPAWQRRGNPTEYFEGLTGGYGPQNELHLRPRLALAVIDSPVDQRRSRYRFLESPI